MPIIYVLILAFAFSPVVLSQPEYESVVTKEIKPSGDKIEVVLKHSQGLRFFAVSFKLAGEGKAENILEIKGSVENITNIYIKDAVVSAELFDKNDNLVTSGTDNIFPKYIEPGYDERGLFSIKVPYNSSIFKCALKITKAEEK